MAVKVGTISGLGIRLQATNLAVAAGVLAERFDHAPDLDFFVKS